MVSAIAAKPSKQRLSSGFFLSDNIDLVLEVRRQGLALTTFSDASFNMGNGMHVGKMNLGSSGLSVKIQRAVARRSWIYALRDFLLMADSRGTVWLRNTMSSAGSYGERAAYIGQKACEHTQSTCAKIYSSVFAVIKNKFVIDCTLCISNNDCV